MKLAQLNVTCNVGSTGRIAEALGSSVIDQGGSSLIIYGRKHNVSRSESVRFNSYADVVMHYATDRLLDSEGLGCRSATAKVIERLERYKPDIIHLHNIHDHWLNYPMLFGYLRDISTPVVWTFHDCWAFTGHCYHYDSAGCYKWQTQCCHCSQRHRFGIDSSSRNFQRKKDLFILPDHRLSVVCVSQWLANQTRQSFFKNERIEVIGNGIDTDVFKTLPSAEKSRKFRIVAVASAWSEAKGLSDFIKLGKELDPQRFEITLVGLSNNQKSHLPERLIGVERTQNVSELVKLYNSADVVLSLSKGETFGLSIIEAMSCGKPVIAYNNTAQPELITPTTGIIVDNNNIKAVANAIRRIEDCTLKFSANDCRNHTISNYHIDNQRSKYIELYRKLI